MLYYIPNRVEAKQKYYCLCVNTLPYRESLTNLKLYLYQNQVDGVVAIAADSNYNYDKEVFVFCETLNATKVAMNILRGKYQTDYPEEMELPSELHNALASEHIAEVHSMDSLVNVFDYYRSPEKDIVQQYELIDGRIKKLKQEALRREIAEAK